MCAVALALGADVRALAPLGEINLDCPAGMLAPTVRGPSERHSVLSLGLSKYADRYHAVAAYAAAACDHLKIGGHPTLVDRAQR